MVEETGGGLKTKNLYYRVPDFQGFPNKLKKFKDSLVRALKPYKDNSKIAEILSSDQVAEAFLGTFFLEGSRMPLFCVFSNLSVEDKLAEDIEDHKKKITLGVRIPGHPFFAEVLQGMSLLVRGFLPYGAFFPVFEPEEVDPASKDLGPHEIELEVRCVRVWDRGSKNTPNNLINKAWVEQLPKYGVQTSIKLAEWREYLDFREQFIALHEKQKFLLLSAEPVSAEPADKCYVCVVVLKADSYAHQLAYIRQCRESGCEVMPYQESADPLNFTPKAQMRSSALALNYRSCAEIKNPKRLKMCEATFKDYLQKQKMRDIRVEDYCFLEIRVEVEEEETPLVLVDEPQEEGSANNPEADTKFPKKPSKTCVVPGFFGRALGGDRAQIGRHRGACKDLIENRNCANPYLANFLFDIKNARQPQELEAIDTWYNTNLNESQKRAVRKMLGVKDIALIQGPPGTGKTMVIAETILQCVQRGQSVLLSSQSHDAIDNALERLPSHPNCKVIRLGANKKRVKDSPYAKEDALRQYYNVLKNHAQEILDPFAKVQEQIEALERWLRDVDYIQEDLESTNTQIEDFRAKITEKQAVLDREQELYERDLADHQRGLELQQAWFSMQEFLEHKRVDMLDMQRLPLNAGAFVQALLNLHQNCLVEQKFTFAEFERASVAHKTHILESLYENYQKLLKSQEQIQKDIAFLERVQETDLQDTGAKIQIEQLEQREKQLAQEMEAGKDVVQEWRAVRQTIIQLKKQHTALKIEHYAIFSDSAQVCSPLESALQARELASLLAQRLDFLQDSALDESLKDLLQEIQAFIPPPLPNATTIGSLQQEIQGLQDQQQGQLKFKEDKEKLATESLQELHGLLGLDGVPPSLEAGREQAQQAYQEAKNKQIEHAAKFESYQGILKKWVQILDRNQVTSDYEEIKDTFKSCCNVVAITSNSSPKEFEGLPEYFDVAIMDEVSKSTPLELLMPLMRARKSILVGDHRQLPPTFREDIYTSEEELKQELQEEGQTPLSKEQSMRFKKMVSATLFKELFEQAPQMLKEQLSDQYRMHPAIMKMVNHFYEEPLTCANPDKDRSHGLQLGGFLTPKTHAVWIDTRTDATTDTQTEPGNYNEQEASLIAKTLKAIDLQLGQREEKIQVGVVSFYQAQVRHIKEQIRKQVGGLNKFQALHVDVNTVIRYQGREKPIVLVSMVATKTKKSQHANTARYEFVNVAFSRAQNLLLVFGSAKVFREQPVYLSDQGDKKSTKVYKKIMEQLEYGFPQSSQCSMEEYQKALKAVLKDSK